MMFSWLFELLEQNDIPLGLFAILLIALLLCLIFFLVSREGRNKPQLIGRCKDCVYIRQETTRTYGCTDYVWLLFPWSKKKGACPVEEQMKIVDADIKLSREQNPKSINLNEIMAKPDLPPIIEYETRKKEIEESTEPIEGIFYIHNGCVIPDYYSECLFSDEENPVRAEMYHHRFYRNYMRRRFTELFSSNEKSIPRGRIAGTLSDPVIYIDKCYKQNMVILNRIKELYHLTSTVVMTNNDYSCPICHNKK